MHTEHEHEPDQSARRRVEPWPLGLAAGLLTVMAIVSGFAWTAGRHPDPLVVADPYEAGRRINAAIRADREARALGVDLDVQVALEPGSSVFVRVLARGPDGEALVPESVRVLRERPAEGMLDEVFQLAPSEAPGESGHAGTIPLPRAGRWRLVVTAVVDGHEVRETHGLGV